jgi:hypothetical protein
MSLLISRTPLPFLYSSHPSFECLSFCPVHTFTVCSHFPLLYLSWYFYTIALCIFICSTFSKFCAFVFLPVCSVLRTKCHTGSSLIVTKQRTLCYSIIGVFHPKATLLFCIVMSSEYQLHILPYVHHDTKVQGPILHDISVPLTSNVRTLSRLVHL